MGEGRYYTAQGVQPSGGYGHDDWPQDVARYPAPQDDAAWAHAQWPDHDAAFHQALPEHGMRPQSVHHAAGIPPQAGQYVARSPYPGNAAHGANPYSKHASEHAQPAPASSAPPLSLGGLARGFGAVASLALMIGGSVWTWQMMQRDVSGVPVVRALEGPARVLPDDPGGTQAAHQGLAVNELAAEGASGLPDEIVLAPQPLDLDLDTTRNAATARPAPTQETLIDVGLPMPGEGESVAQSAPPLGFVSPNRSAVARSPRPVSRSATAMRAPVSPAAPDVSAADVTLAAAVANSVAADLSRSGAVDVDPASIGPGTRLVQLGTYESATEARSSWDALAQRFSPMLDDRGRVIEAAHSGGSVFYRLRAHGFSDERDARRFCAALIDQRLDCIPVLIR